MLLLHLGLTISQEEELSAQSHFFRSSWHILLLSRTGYAFFFLKRHSLFTSLHFVINTWNCANIQEARVFKLMRVFQTQNLTRLIGMAAMFS